jgi:hypothetical protein
MQRLSGALAAYAGRLLLEGQTGWLALVDQATGQDVARRYLRAAPSPTWTKQKCGGCDPMRVAPDPQHRG